MPTPPAISETPPPTRRILLADDDRVLSDLLAQYFRGEGYAVAQAFDGAQAVQAAQRRFDVIIADVMMPRMDGFETLRALRQADHPARATPVIMLTAKGEAIDRIVGLEMGADDYLPKPCDPRELLARVKAVLRRAERAESFAPPLRAGALRLDPAQRAARAHDAALALTDSEFNVLEALLRARGRLVERGALSRSALGRELGPHDRALDMHISHLRRKLERARCAVAIKTVRGRGFVLSEDDE